MYTVVIIEDDPMITRLNRRYVEQDSRFAVVQTFSAAHPALFWLQHNPIDLIILDVYMPQMSGTELLLQLRAKGVDADVIMVTSANDAKTVNDAVRLGAVDYLVKPFAYERFQQALEVFCRRRESVQRDSFSQDALDHTLFRADGRRRRLLLPRRACKARLLRGSRPICAPRRTSGTRAMKSPRTSVCRS